MVQMAARTSITYRYVQKNYQTQSILFYISARTWHYGRHSVVTLSILVFVELLPPPTSSVITSSTLPCGQLVRNAEAKKNIYISIKDNQLKVIYTPRRQKCTSRVLYSCDKSTTTVKCDEQTFCLHFFSTRLTTKSSPNLNVNYRMRRLCPLNYAPYSRMPHPPCLRWPKIMR